ncbi:hypothetical protein RUND412_000356 [Rhizina undulata]
MIFSIFNGVFWIIFATYISLSAGDSIKLVNPHYVPDAIKPLLINNAALSLFNTTTQTADPFGADDSVLLHTLSKEQVEAVDICKSYAFSPTVANYHISGAGQWLRSYTLANRNRPFMKSHGLVATIAYDYLGDTNWKCAIGTIASCSIKCTDVVEHVEDLVEARRVYFVLASVGHFVNVADLIHTSLISAQSNVGLMASRMSFTFFWWTPSQEEVFRENLYRSLQKATVWAVQSLLNSVVPVIPWGEIQKFIMLKLSLAMDKPISDIGEFKSAFHDLHPENAEFQEIIDRYYQMFEDVQDYEINVPEQFGGQYRFTPNGNTLHGWWSNNVHVFYREWQRKIYGEWHYMRWLGHERGKEYGMYPYGFFKDFRGRWNKAGFKKAIQHAWLDFKELVENSFQGGRDKQIIERNELGFQINKSPFEERRSKALEESAELGDKRIISHGEVRPGRLEAGKSFNQYKLDMQTRLWPIPDEPDRVWDKGNLEIKLKVAQAVFNVFVNGGINHLLPGNLASLFDHWKGENNPHSFNDAAMKFIIGHSVQATRTNMVDSVNRVMRSMDISDDGSTELSRILEYGSFLPAHGGSLSKWTHSDVEKSLTKNLFYKTLNSALRSQKVYISCTSHITDKIDLYLSGDLEAILEDSCAQDKSGPQNLKACIGDKVCYLYRWNDRGVKIAHHNEEPFGFDQIEDEPWEVNPEAIIKSSVNMYILQLGNGTDISVLASSLPLLAIGPSAEAISNPEFPGVFTIPVCVSPYNWNTQLDGYGFHDDINPHSSKKNLPCYCGPLGSETKQIMKAVGFHSSGARDRYYKELCPRQIKEKIKDPLEQYMALCRLNVHVSGLLIKNGKDKFCDVVIKEIEGAGYASITQEMHPEIRDAFMCKIERKKNGKCRKYKNSPFSKVWEETREVVEKE